MESFMLGYATKWGLNTSPNQASPSPRNVVLTSKTEFSLLNTKGVICTQIILLYPIDY